jgi:hypothetical protein
MATRPAYVWTGSDWDDIGDKRLSASVTALNSSLGSKLDLAGGKILQIVRATDSTFRGTTSTSFGDVTGMSVTITPQKSDSAILIVSIFSANVNKASGGNIFGLYQLTDASNNALSGAEGLTFGTINYTITGTAELFASGFLWGRSTPATTSAVTYKLRQRSENASTATIVRNDLQTGQMYAIEVSA